MFPARSKSLAVVDGIDEARLSGLCRALVYHIDRNLLDVRHIERQLPAAGPVRRVADRCPQPEPRTGEPEIHQVGGDRPEVLIAIEPGGILWPKALVLVFDEADVWGQIDSKIRCSQLQWLRNRTARTAQDQQRGKSYQQPAHIC